MHIICEFECVQMAPKLSLYRVQSRITASRPSVIDVPRWKQMHSRRAPPLADALTVSAFVRTWTRRGTE